MSYGDRATALRLTQLRIDPATQSLHHGRCKLCSWFSMNLHALSYIILRASSEGAVEITDMHRERSSSVVECLTRDRGAAGSSLNGVTALWSLSKTHLSCLSTGSNQEEPSLFNWKIVYRTKESNQTNKRVRMLVLALAGLQQVSKSQHMQAYFPQGYKTFIHFLLINR